MSEHVIHWEYELRNSLGHKIAITPKMEISEDEQAAGVLGLMRWNNRVRKLEPDIGYSFIKSWIQEHDEERVTLIELEMKYEDGYYNYRGKFPIVII